VHLTSSAADWYAARAAGVVAYVLLTLVVVVGIALAGQVRPRRWPRFAIEEVHRFGGLLIGTFVALHVVTIAADSLAGFSVAQLVVPLAAHYRPFWTALGIVAAELLLALAVANRYRSRLPYRFWRRTHYLNFAVWALATLHAAVGGTDRSSPWLVLLVLSSTAAVCGATVFRIGRAGPRVRVSARPGA
jgi:methionine sulfoxide reductase heme-binding subunit